MRALRSRTVESDSGSNEQIMDKSEHVTEEIISKKGKRKKSKKHTSDSESTEHPLEELKCTAENYISKPIKRKKSKKRTSVIRENNEYATADSEPGTGAETSVSKKVKRKKSKNPASVSNEHIMEDSEHGADTEETLSKKIKRRKSKKHTSEENDVHSDKVEEKMAKKKKKSKKRTTLVENSSEDQTTETVSNISREYQSATDDPIEELVKQVSRKPREFLRSTISNIPDFDNAITSTAIKPRKPEISSEDSEDTKFEKKLKKLKRDRKRRRQPKTENIKKDSDMELSSRESSSTLPKSKVLNETKTKRSSLARLSKTDSSVTDKEKDSFEWNSPNKSIKQDNTFDNNRKSVSSRRETFNKTPNNNLNVSSVIAVSYSAEITRVVQGNKSNLTEPQVTSDEEMITDDSLDKSSKIEENKRMSEPNRKEILYTVENSVITISDTPERTNLQQNTFNKSETQEPELTSDEDSETNDCELKQIPNKINESGKSETLGQRLNTTKVKESLGLQTQNNASFNRRGTFCKTPINESSLTSEKSERSEEDSDKECEGLSDVSESILQDFIYISADSPEKTKLKNSTFNLSSNSANTTINKPESEIVKIDNTFEVKIANTSGDWQVEKILVDSNEDLDKKLNDTFDVENKENDSQDSNSSQGNSTIIVTESNNTTMQNENVSLSPKDKSVRKKWLKFHRHSSEAQTVLDQINSPVLKKKLNPSIMVQKIISTPVNLFNMQKRQTASSNLSVKNISFKKSPVKSIKKSPVKSIKKSPLKSIKKSTGKSSVNGNSTQKSGTKRTAMPNFAMIHKKAYEKMENLKEYSERKQQRAQMLLSSNKSDSKRKSLSKIHKEKQEETKIKSSRQLFANNTTDSNKYNRFGFKITEPTKKPTYVPESSTKNVVIAKPVIKQPIFARSDIVAIANKNKVATNNRENRRDMLKGVRTNRRFDLLMQMRNK